MKGLILVFTLKAFANSSPGLLQPWACQNEGVLTLKALANVGRTRLANSFRVELRLTNRIPGLKQPWAATG